MIQGKSDKHVGLLINYVIICNNFNDEHSIMTIMKRLSKSA